MSVETSNDDDELALRTAYATELGSVRLDARRLERTDGPYLVFETVKVHERLVAALLCAQAQVPESNFFRERSTLVSRRKVPQIRVGMPEAQLLRATLSGSLTVDQHTFESDFFSRYIHSVFNYENQIVADGNYLVYGRRGSGKSSLLSYAMHLRRKQGRPYAWISLQAYSKRSDVGVSVDVLIAVMEQIQPTAETVNRHVEIKATLQTLRGMEDDVAAQRGLERLLPLIGRFIAALTTDQSDLVIFLDDLHVLDGGYQSRLLAHLYAASRGNRCHLKISGIEQFSRPWDSARREGLESPHDAQVLKLDYNLTMPDKSRRHIESILDAHAQFCGLPDVGFLCRPGALARLVWVAAAVPRDALSIFAQALTKASAQEQRFVSITSVNAAASETAEQKLRDIEREHKDRFDNTRQTLERIKEFCITSRRKNAFLIEIRNDDSAFRATQDLIALRLLHVLHEGITPHSAGRRYQALLLDYGFYVGIRAAKSVDLFQKEPKTPSVEQLRKLPIFGETSLRPVKNRVAAKAKVTAKKKARASSKSKIKARTKTKTKAQSHVKAKAKAATKARPKR